MSQLFDYFACSRPVIDRWADALVQGDEHLQTRIVSEMPRFITLKNIGQDEFNILAQCISSDDVDLVKAVGQIDLVRAISETEGPWVIAFRQPAIDAVARMSISEPLIHRWIRATAAFQEVQENRMATLLTTDVATTFMEMCSTAVEKQLGVFACFHG